MKHNQHYKRPMKQQSRTVYLHDITDPLGALMAKYIRQASGLHPSIPIKADYLMVNKRK